MWFHPDWVWSLDMNQKKQLLDFIAGRDNAVLNKAAQVCYFGFDETKEQFVNSYLGEPTVDCYTCGSSQGYFFCVDCHKIMCNCAEDCTYSYECIRCQELKVSCQDCGWENRHSVLCEARGVRTLFAAVSVNWNIAELEVVHAPFARRMHSICSCRTRLCKMLHRIGW